MNPCSAPSPIAFMHQLADAARPIALRYFRSPLVVERKGDDSPVTQADRKIERCMRELIQTTYPADGIFGEEEDALGSDREKVWVLDPIDGTKSFISGVPSFGTLVALLDNGAPVAGLIDMPALDERWTGQKGAVTTFNGQACTTRKNRSLAEATLFATSPDMFKGGDADRFSDISRRVALRRFGGDCHAYGLLASGWIDAVIECGLKPYDYLAMVPVIEGAGGKVTDWNGHPLTLKSDGRVVASATPALHAELLQILGD